jgi:hypothetical protein
MTDKLAELFADDASRAAPVRRGPAPRPRVAVR